MKLDNYKCEGQLSIFDYLKAADPEPEKPKHIPPIYEYLRYGPHTLIPKVAEEAKAYLEKYGVPADWEKWDKNNLACSNCTWFDGANCRGGGHTCHYEFGFLVCDNFKQSITERTPRTVGDAYPSKFKEIQKELREEEKAKAADKQPVTKYTCTIIGKECKAHSYKGCSMPGKCELLKQAVIGNNPEPKESEPFMNPPEEPKTAADPEARQLKNEQPKRAAGQTVDRYGRLREAPDWMDPKRCETCKYWSRYPVEEQPPAGWGVYGQCDYYHEPEMMKNGYWKVSKTSCCCDYKAKY